MDNAFNKNKIQKGDFGENLVSQFLIKQGFVIKAKKYRRKLGEIDLIAEKNDILAFVEVKLRENIYFDISEVVNITKQQKIILAAKEYISCNNISDKICRFDVALVEQKSNNNFNIKYIPNAFTEEF